MSIEVAIDRSSPSIEDDGRRATGDGRRATGDGRRATTPQRRPRDVLRDIRDVPDRARGHRARGGVRKSVDRQSDRGARGRWRRFDDEDEDEDEDDG